MIKLITDTSTLYSPLEGEQLGLDVLPLQVTINQQTYREFVDIDSDAFLDLVKQGNIPSSSQPSIGEVIEHYEKYPDDEIINICMADGLSGTYLSALGAKEGLLHHEHIHVINSKTLCGPHRYLVELALKAVHAGKSVEEIKTLMQSKMDTVRSFLLPQDFDFLMRGGRLTPLAAKIGGLLKIQPVMMQTEDGTRLEKYTVARTFSGGINALIKEFQNLSEPERYRVYISHANVKEQAEKIKEGFLKKFPDLEIEVLKLSPAFITQGGPGCIAIQWIMN